MKNIEEARKGDIPSDPKLGELFDKFCEGDHGKALLDIQAIKDGDSDEWKTLIIKNRMRRSFEAGFETCEFGGVLTPEVRAQVEEILCSP